MSDSFATPWAVVCQAPLSMGFPRQENWSGWLFPSPHLSDSGIELMPPALQVDSLPLNHLGNPDRMIIIVKCFKVQKKQGHYDVVIILRFIKVPSVPLW